MAKDDKDQAKAVELDGKEVNVNDKLYSYTYEWGTVNELTDEEIIMDFSLKEFIPFTHDGRLNTDAKNQDLFWEEVEIKTQDEGEEDVPEKEKVKKYQFILLDETTGRYAMSQERFEDVNDVVMNLGSYYTIIEPYKRSEIEV